MNTIRFTQEDAEAAAQLLMEGNVVAFPTDTVYGLGVVYDDEEALRALKEAKGRPENKPIPTMVSSIEQLKQVACMNDTARQLAEAFMPGALTMILKKRDDVADYITNGMPTIGIRMPDDEWVLDLIDRCEKPLLVTSANLSDQPSGLSDEDVLKQLDGRIDAIVMGNAMGECASTIVDVSEDSWRIVREGPITKEMIEEILNS